MPGPGKKLGRPRGGTGRKSEQRKVSAPTAWWAAVEAAADREGLSVSAWLRLAACAALQAADDSTCTP